MLVKGKLWTSSFSSSISIVSNSLVDVEADGMTVGITELVVTTADAGLLALAAADLDDSRIPVHNVDNNIIKISHNHHHRQHQSQS